jgi:hypothetical protein
MSLIRLSLRKARRILPRPARGKHHRITTKKLERGFVWKGKKTVALLQVMHAPGRKKEISDA